MSTVALSPPLRLVEATQAERAPVNKWLVTLSVSFGTLMGAIDASIVNVALTHIRGSVGATLEEITWISTGFVVATVLVMPLTAFLGRLVGQKRLYMISLVVFLAGSALCGMAWSLWSLVFFRVIQGFGAGALQPTEQAILRQTFPPKEQGMAMALFAMAVMLGPAFGPTLGGILVDNASWPWIFYINIPVGLLGLVMVWRFVHEPEDIRSANALAATEQKKNIDWQGIALLSVGLAALQYFLEEGDKNSWFDSRLITFCLILAGLALAAFVMRELSAKVPAVNLKLFKDPVFASGTLIGSVMFAMLMANLFLLPVFMQELLGFDATQSGVSLMPRTLVMMAVVPVVGRLYNIVSPRILVGIGVVAFSVGAYQMSHFTLDTGTAQIVGSEFMAKHKTHDDPVTRISPDATYHVAGPTRHPVEENERVLKFSLADGKILAVWGKQGWGPGEFDWVHGIVQDSKGAVYAADTYGQRLQKFVPAGTSSTAQ